ncbi:serine hydrolase domain-containing protein [Pseudoroseicyclus tamaricis]|uniref:Beta-lactamase family protein n=1 Tax=Pseudoroseicyclus tamaricis TaxID=2705421 RepID=A0A6B2JUH3_9RHOB|nr:serine hydrolase domain-containing protein [Pseudoroseicyclus tamaricis]NDV01575.1 beta-lactamase family protein [Pseudoroseicyclus tamaricis]
MLRPLAISLCLTAPAAEAQDIGARLQEAWRGWVEEGGTEVATLAVLHDGELVVEEGLGAGADAALPLASLSKPLTAACALALPELTAQTKVGSLLGGKGTAAEAELGALLTHSAGIWPDATQGNAAIVLSEEPMTGEVARVALARAEQEGEPGSYAYNNENYALVGAMIEAATGESYAEACDAALMAPLGLQSAALTGPWVGQGPWGGWQMSAADYARFVEATFGPEGSVDPASAPMLDLGDGFATLGGALSRELEGRRLYWGFGQLCWDGRGDGSYFASYGNGWVVVVLHNDCPPDERLAALDAALFEAAHP